MFYITVKGSILPVRFGKVEDFKEILAEIGKVALECLLKDDHVFEYDQLSAAILCEESLIIGLLQVSEYAENLQPAGMVSFIHKSIQEFLSGVVHHYRCVPEGNLGGIEEYASTLKDCEAWENVFQFICGLSDDGSSEGKVLGGVIRNSKHLKMIQVAESDDSVCDLLEQVVNPSKCSLEIGFGLFDEGCDLTSVGTVKLASLLPRFNNIIDLWLDLSDCCAAAVDTLRS
ncbi:hypothetical protein OS493_020573 [Desmophyllum pertusum]|uniref:Uncharacterized protein n=1 Tax=Desmophyllum pertusum TaxID=174260 RepID=A0A9X0CQC1_9CNID|nr:hypothetical protein OS493_020573 [Desmophyllum pertusum]